jgi:hypothetical protein
MKIYVDFCLCSGTSLNTNCCLICADRLQYLNGFSCFWLM